jgi:hypothetical protein
MMSSKSHSCRYLSALLEDLKGRAYLGEENILQSPRLFQELVVDLSISNKEILELAAVRCVCHCVDMKFSRKKSSKSVSDRDNVDVIYTCIDFPPASGDCIGPCPPYSRLTDKITDTPAYAFA